MNPSNDLNVAQAHDTESSSSSSSCATDDRDCAIRGKRRYGDEAPIQPPAKKIQAEIVDAEYPAVKERFQVRTLSLLSPKTDDLSPQEKRDKRAEIADILDQATRVALEIGSMYATTPTSSSVAATNPATAVGLGGHRRYQRRNSFVDRRRFLAPTIVLDGPGNSNSLENRTAGGLPLPPLSMPLRHSFTAGCESQGSMTVLSAIEADYQRRRTSMSSLLTEDDMSKV
jgi:hypothetical protein